jgi:uncharacterized repeat protein (TIGR03806 family)
VTRTRRQRLFGVMVGTADLLLVAFLACDGSHPERRRITSDAPPPPELGPVGVALGLDARPWNPTCVAPPRPPPPPVYPPVAWERVFANVQLENPVMMAQIPGDDSRWFVAERTQPGGGDARIVSFNTLRPQASPSVVATLGPLGDVIEGDGEGGLLGIAFHPQFATNGRLYVSWVKADPTSGSGVSSAVGYLTSTDGGAHFSGYEELFSFPQSISHYHKGGGLAFGPDGFLYASFGDGGTQDDFFWHGQDRNYFFGKIHRLDVDHEEDGKPYAIPDGNPFKHGGGQPTTFAWGLRNPFRFSIDRETNQLWAGDVGGSLYEEIDLVVAGGNYGWPCKEGFHDHILPPDPRCPSNANLVDPVIEQAHDNHSRAIIGGVVYRGKAIPILVGTYVFGDFAARELWALELDPSTHATTLTWLNKSGTPQAPWVDFAEDAEGEIYALGMDGAIYQLVPAPVQPDHFPHLLSSTGCVDRKNPQVPASGLIPYSVSAPLWSDGADKERYLAIPDGTTIGIRADGHFELPIGTVLMKTFRLGGRPVETRLFIRHDDGGWAGYSYEWLDDLSDAVLLPSSKEKPVGAQTWTYPARGQCLLCHNQAAGPSLGTELAQLDHDFVYPTTQRRANQLDTLEYIGMFSAPIERARGVVYPNPFGAAPLGERARAYLHANCSTCHRPGATGIVDMDLRFSTLLEKTGTCGVPATEGTFGVAGAERLVPGAPKLSLISLRPHWTSANRMPPLATSVVDKRGVVLIDEWIRSLRSCRAFVPYLAP